MYAFRFDTEVVPVSSDLLLYQWTLASVYMEICFMRSRQCTLFLRFEFLSKCHAMSAFGWLVTCKVWRHLFSAIECPRGFSV